MFPDLVGSEWGEALTRGWHRGVYSNCVVIWRAAIWAWPALAIHCVRHVAAVGVPVVYADVLLTRQPLTPVAWHVPPGVGAASHFPTVPLPGLALASPISMAL